MQDLFKAIAFSLVPPWDGDPMKVRNWSVAVCIILYLLVISVIWGAGWLPRMFGSGYALAEDVRTTIAQQNAQLSLVQSSVTSLRVKAIQDELQRNELRRCHVIATKDVDVGLKQQALDTVNQLIEAGASQFSNLTGRAYQQQPCEILMIGSEN